MIKKIGVSFLILFVLIFQLDYKKQTAQAFFPAAIVPISYIATALVAAGATGYVQQSVDGEFYGSLWDAAKSTYESMSSDLKSGLNTALAVGSFVTMSSVPGLWEFLHGEFSKPESIVPSVAGLYDLNEVFNGQWYLRYDYQWGVEAHDHSGGTSAYWIHWNIPTRVSLGSQKYKATSLTWKYGPSTFTQAQKDALTATAFEYIKNKEFNYMIETVLAQGIGTGSYPAISPPTTSIQDGDATRPINPPADPLSLNMATPVSTYLDRNGVLTTPIPDVDTQTETGDIDALKAAAAAAAAAAYAAAIAAGLSPSQALQNAIDAALAEGVSLDIAQTIAQTQADIYAEDTVTDYADPIKDSMTDPLNLDFFKNTMLKLQEFDTSKGVAPKVTIPLNKMVNCFAPITGITNPFPQEDYTIVDFAYFDTLQYKGTSLIDYFRMIIGFGFLINTFMYCYRRIYSGKVIS